jgi:hypothetical protein
MRVWFSQIIKDMNIVTNIMNGFITEMVNNVRNVWQIRNSAVIVKCSMKSQHLMPKQNSYVICVIKRCLRSNASTITKRYAHSSKSVQLADIDVLMAFINARKLPVTKCSHRQNYTQKRIASSRSISRVCSSHIKQMKRTRSTYVFTNRG